MQIWLTHKFAEAIDGIDLSGHRVGDLIEVSPRDGWTLIAEGWAVQVVQSLVRRTALMAGPFSRATSDGRDRRSFLTAIRNRIEHQVVDEHDHRRAEDRFREELRDSRAKTVSKDPA